MMASAAPRPRDVDATIGTSCKPARCAARQRARPDDLELVGRAAHRRTTIGWMIPFSRSDAASSSRSASGKSRRGLRGLGRRNSTGARR